MSNGSSERATTLPVDSNLERGEAFLFPTTFTFEGTTYKLPTGVRLEDNDHIQFPDGRIVRVQGLIETDPPQPYELVLVENYDGPSILATEATVVADSQTSERFPNQ